MKFNLKIFLKSMFILFISFFAFLLIICYPQAYYFKDSLEYKNFHIFYDKKIPNQIYAILDRSELLIQKSDLYDPKLKFKIFLRSDTDKYNVLPLQFPDSCTGWTIPIIKNVFLYKSDCETNTSYNHLGHERSLSSILAHELTHVLVENKLFFKSKMAYFNQKNISDFGALWKEEGYAEYIAGGSPINLDEGLNILNGHALPEYIPHLEYFKYWLAVRYLILNKHMTFEEILDATLNLEDVINEAKHNENIIYGY